MSLNNRSCSALLDRPGFSPTLSHSAVRWWWFSTRKQLSSLHHQFLPVQFISASFSSSFGFRGSLSNTPPLYHSTTLSLLHSTNPPLCHSITLPFHYSTNPPFHHSTNPTLYLSITSPLSCSMTPPLYHATIVQLHHFVFSGSQVIPLSRTFLWTILMCLFYLSCLSFSFVTNKSSPSPRSHKDAIYN